MEAALSWPSARGRSLFLALLLAVGAMAAFEKGAPYEELKKDFVSLLEEKRAVSKAPKNGKELQAKLNAGYDPNSELKPGVPLLYFAAAKGERDMTAMLLTAGADINVRGMDGFTALAAAAMGGKSLVVKLLLEKGADLEPQLGGKYRKETPLFLAVMKNHPACITTLLKHKANVNALNSDNMTPLHIAVLSGKPKIVKQLLKAGADVTIVAKGKTALQFARMKKFKSIVAMLKKATAAEREL